MSNLLDTLEFAFTQRPKRIRPRWLVYYNPSLALKPFEPFPLRMLLRTIFLTPLRTTVMLCACYGILTFAALGIILATHPDYFKHYKIVQFVVGQFWLFFATKLPLIPSIYLISVLVNLLLQLPRYYFWNRRATRLIAEGVTSEALPSEPPMTDGNVWPPPPLVIVPEPEH